MHQVVCLCDAQVAMSVKPEGAAALRRALTFQMLSLDEILTLMDKAGGQQQYVFRYDPERQEEVVAGMLEERGPAKWEIVIGKKEDNGEPEPKPAEEPEQQEQEHDQGDQEDDETQFIKSVESYSATIGTADTGDVHEPQDSSAAAKESQKAEQPEQPEQQEQESPDRRQEETQRSPSKPAEAPRFACCFKAGIECGGCAGACVPPSGRQFLKKEQQQLASPLGAGAAAAAAAPAPPPTTTAASMQEQAVGAAEPAQVAAGSPDTQVGDAPSSESVLPQGGFMPDSCDEDGEDSPRGAAANEEESADLAERQPQTARSHSQEGKDDDDDDDAGRQDQQHKEVVGAPAAGAVHGGGFMPDSEEEDATAAGAGAGVQEKMRQLAREMLETMLCKPGSQNAGLPLVQAQVVVELEEAIHAVTPPSSKDAAYRAKIKALIAAVKPTGVAAATLRKLLDARAVPFCELARMEPAKLTEESLGELATRWERPAAVCLR